MAKPISNHKRLQNSEIHTKTQEAMNHAHKMQEESQELAKNKGNKFLIKSMNSQIFPEKNEWKN